MPEFQCLGDPADALQEFPSLGRYLVPRYRSLPSLEEASFDQELKISVELRIAQISVKANIRLTGLPKPQNISDDLDTGPSGSHLVLRSRG